MILSAQILKILKAGPETGMIVSGLRVELSVQYDRPIGDAEMRDALAGLRAAGFTKESTDDLTGDPKVALTAAGRKRAKRV